MFNRLKKKPYVPVAPANNPGRMLEAALNFDGPTPHSEQLQMLPLLAAQLELAGFSAQLREHWLQLPNGLYLQPLLMGVEARDDGKLSTGTTISVCHEKWIPQGLFEYQYAVDDTATQSVQQGMAQWIRMDLQTLCDAIAEPGEGPDERMRMEMDFPASEAHGALQRRVVFGSTAHLRREPDDAADAEHPFCPCCLFTNAMGSFDAQLKSEQLYGLRLFAARSQDGEVEADCRVNGEEWPQGAEALMEYARSWPAQGFEFRKQYVVIRSY